jgi:hypothetical protein
VSVQDVDRDSVLAAVRAGYTSRPALADHFRVLLGPGRTLTTVVDVLLEDEELTESDRGVLTVAADPPLFNLEEA